jgi:hypothetical protein
MKKRSAMLIAAGLVLTLGIGGLAVSLGLTGPAPVNAAAAAPERVVRVERRTVTVHRTAEAAPVATTQTSSSAPGSDDLDAEHEGEDGQEHEIEDHEGFEIEDD